MSITVYAPAKVNLFLQIKGKRQDGYHELVTVFQSVDLCDTLYISLEGSGINLTAPEHIPQHHDNLAYSAAHLFYASTGLRPGVSIELKKIIPVEAGLGGGSSDAAAVLRGLNMLYYHPLTAGQIQRVASQLGSDVSFFLCGGMAVGRGRGDLIEPVPDVLPLWFRLVKPPFGLSTPHVYANWDGTSHADWQEFEQSLRGPVEGLRLFNDLEVPALRIRPELSSLKSQLLQNGAVQALLSGSGSTVFGVYTQQPDLDMSLPEGYQQWTVRSLSRAEMGRECNTLG
ncbi:MAG: 4-(cytidine 5'-diphospho)-2-C-methyl-D-erythritol kinase [Bacillota bacterium]|nr:4-(cytidine 5'-diphospho)-2-C-methyl-D-erythritol kinase [Bacillota bacterium]